MAYAFNGSTQYIFGDQSVNAAPLTLYVNGSCNNLGAQQFALALGHTNGSFIALAYRGDVNNDPVTAYESNFIQTPYSASLTAYRQSIFESVAAVFVSNEYRSVYLNGVEGIPNTHVLPTDANANKTSIGVLFRVTAVAYFTGITAECAIWNVVLTSAEIASLAKGFSPRRIRPQSRVFYAPLIRNIQDLQKALALTPVNGPTVAAHPRVYA